MKKYRIKVDKWPDHSSYSIEESSVEGNWILIETNLSSLLEAKRVVNSLVLLDEYLNAHVTEYIYFT